MVDAILDELVTAAQEAFRVDLVAVVLFGSAAEGRLRKTSDVNVIVVTRRFEPAAAEKLEELIRRGRAAVGLHVMFIEHAEIAPASIAFAQKFFDIGRRRKVLWGPDVFEGLQIDRAALIARERQVLLNLSLRMRARFSESATHEDELAHSLADHIGPLRASAGCLAQLESGANLPGREALATLAKQSGLTGLTDTYSRLREGADLAPGTAKKAFLDTLDLIAHMERKLGAL
jgi:predicted nucleotidyltransferase